MVFAQVHFFVLKWSDEDRMIALGPKFREGESFVAPLFMKANQFIRGVFAAELFEGFLEVNPRGEREIATGGDELGDVETAKMFAEEGRGESFGFGSG